MTDWSNIKLATLSDWAAALHGWADPLRALKAQAGRRAQSPARRKT